MRGNMNRQLFLLFATLVASISVFAAENAKIAVNLPCKNIESACEAGGFKKHGHQLNDGMWSQCMKPILEGRSINGVSVKSEDIASCNRIRTQSNIKK